MKIRTLILSILVMLLLVSSTTAWIFPPDSPAVWEPLEDQIIPYGSADNTIVYQNILSKCSDPKYPEIITVASNHNDYNLAISGVDLVIHNLNPDYYGTQTVKLSCNGIPAYFQLTIQNIAPVADAGPDQTVQVGQTVYFDGSNSCDPDGSLIAYSWDFDYQGDKAYTPTASYTYETPGTYTVTLTVVDDLGLMSQDTINIQVLSPGNQPPVADAGHDMTVAAGSTITLDASNSYDPDGTIDLYEWRVIDTYTQQTVLVSANEITNVALGQGNYAALLTVTDNEGATAQDTITIISDGIPTAVAGGPYFGTVGQAITLDASQSTDDTRIVSYHWDLGNGEQIDTSNPTAIYIPLEAGNYQITLTVTDDNNLQDSDTTTAIIVEQAETETHQRTIFKRIRYNDYVQAGNLFRLSVNVFNDGSDDMEDVKITAYLFDLEERRTAGPFDVDKGEEVTANLYLDIPENAQPGNYDLRIIASNDDFSHNEHRIVTVI